MRLFHFSDDPGIQCFVPKPVAVAAERAPGMDWLNGPLVWAIDDERQHELPVDAFESLADAGMRVARVPVLPVAFETLTDLPGALAARGVERRVLDSLVPLKDVWSSSLHVSGIRLRNARGWLAAR